MRNPRTATDASDAKFRIILNLRTHPFYSRILFLHTHHCYMRAAFHPLPRRTSPGRVYPVAERHGKVMIP